MTAFGRLMLVSLTTCVATAWGQSDTRSPHVGYLYPAGGQQGAVFQITAGGQFLNGVNNVYVSGEGVRASVIQYARPLNNKQLQALRKEMIALQQRRIGPAAIKDKAPGGEKPEVEIPWDHPLLRDLDKMSIPELKHYVAQFLAPAKKQPNAQLAEMVIIEVTIDPGAAPGDRELRLWTPNGLTNPVCFQVGQLPEIREHEPNDREASEAARIELPIVLNGQIMPGDVDRFRISVRRGQQLVMQTQARRLMPYLADAVPGWFQATLALYDAKGNEVAFADDYRFDPDPVLFYKIPEDGEYDLEIRDSVYRGREDFVYRIAVGELPFITSVSPLGGQEGDKTVASITGWNLADMRLRLDTEPGGDDIRQTALCRDGWTSNSVTYAVDTLPECREEEPNDTVRGAQTISLPRVVNGCIAGLGDVDVFRFKGRAGDEVAAEVVSRRLNSPLDSLLRLTDESGRVLEWNDDRKELNTGLLTHQADSYLRARLQEDGVYYLHLSDSQQQGGEAYGYRLRISPPQPDFALRVTPSSINIPAGRAVPIQMHVLRKDGFNGEIELVLKDAPAGFTLSGGRIPAQFVKPRQTVGCDCIRMTLTAPPDPIDQPVVLRLEGHARIGEQEVVRPAVPAEDMMQAFAYRHLAPSQELMAAVTGARPAQGRPAGKRPGPLSELVSDVPVRIPVGGAVEVRIKTQKHPRLQDVQLKLCQPPKGVTLHEVQVVPGGLAFLLRADGDTHQAGFADNLIVEAFIDVEGETQSGKPPSRKRRVSFGVLPAIPIEIVK